MENTISFGKDSFTCIGLLRMIEVIIRAEAQPKIEDVDMKKSKKYGIFGLSYCIPLSSILKILSSFMVVPVARQSKAWLSLCITVPGRRNDLTIFTFRYFDHSFSMPKLVKTITMKPKAKAKYTVSGLLVCRG
jgi:hypothetical protein